jgi:hypothetical protein
MDLEAVNVSLSDLKYSIDWNGVKLHIENVNGNLNIMFDSDIQIGINGELGIASIENIHIDTINSKLYFNSRRSKALKDLPESIEYRKQCEEHDKKQQLLIAHEHESFMKRIEDLEDQMKELKKENK